MQRIFLMSARKSWYHDIPVGWEEVFWERGDYVECGIFEKPISELTDEDNELVKHHGARPEDWPYFEGNRFADDDSDIRDITGIMDLMQEFETALEMIEEMNSMWSWRNIHRNDEASFKRVQEFLKKHDMTHKECKF